MTTLQKRTIGNWLTAVQDGILCLPRFQREYVWKPAHVEKLLETLIIKGNIPIGVFLILETLSDTKHQIFKTRNIDGVPDNGEEKCTELLLDGQQRLTALWKSLNDNEEDDYIFYVNFDDYKPESIDKRKRKTKATIRFSNDPMLQFKKSCFPVSLLSPLAKSNVVGEWIKKLTCDESTKIQVKEMIVNARKLFSKGGGLSISYFKLGNDIGAITAIDIYEKLNTNSIRLSDFHLAIAKMESESKQSPHGLKSLYDLADELEDSTRVARIESDAVGELILKIFCLIKGKMPSGKAYKDLPYKELEAMAPSIVDGVKWTIEKLGNLGIWDAKQLPSVVPLRVLPALHVVCGGIDDITRNRVVINRYLWHAFLTDRYSKQANQRLKEDFDDLVEYIKKTKKVRKTGIFEHSPEYDKIKEVGWPHATAKSIMARGILLVCCSGGAENLKDGVKLGKTNISDRERHHIFPRACAVKADKEIVMNCMLIPKKENLKFSNHLPGDYIAGLIAEIRGLGKLLPEVDVVDRLDTHCIEKGVATRLVGIVDGKKIDLEEEFADFIEERSDVLAGKIRKLLKDGEL